MSQIIEVKVPDIGDFSDVPVIDLFVKVGDSIKVDDAIATLESDKATMDVPSTVAGVVRKCWSSSVPRSAKVRADQGRKLGAAAAAAPPRAAAPPGRPLPLPARCCRCPAAGGGVVEVKVPDIGDFSDVPVIDLFVKVGDSIKVDDAIATLESDKATMDVPSTVAGVVKEVLVQLGSKVSEGSLLIKVETGAAAAAAGSTPRPALPPPPAAPVAAAPLRRCRPALAPAPCRSAPGSCLAVGPRLCPRTRRRPVKVQATGPKGRIVKEDLTKYVKGVMSGAISGPVASAGGRYQRRWRARPAALAEGRFRQVR